MTQIKKISLITVDTLRHDCIKYLSDKKYLERDRVLDLLDTPTLDNLAKKSVCFTKCYTSSSITSAVHSSIFSGTTQANHTIRCTTTSTTSHVMNKNVITIAEILKKLGFKTVFMSESLSILKIPEITRGFDNLFKNEKDLFNFLEKHKDDKIFLFSLFQDVHAPYLYSSVPPHKGYNDDFFETMKKIYKKYKMTMPSKPVEIWSNLYKKVDSSRSLWFPLYVRGVTKFDKGRFKIFIEKLNQFGFNDTDTSMMILTADHGEGRNRPGRDSFEHNGEAYDEIARVPLLVRLPNKKHEINKNLVSNIDIFSIILDQCTDFKTTEYVDYKLYSINPFITKRPFAWYIYGIDLSLDGKKFLLQSRTIITDKKKFILRGRPEVYLSDDAFEVDNEEFVTNLFENLYYRATKEQTIKNYVQKMKHNTVAKKLFGNIASLGSRKDGTKNYVKQINKGTITKKALYRSFLLSEEYRKKRIFSVIDLVNDPLEETEISPISNLEIFMEYTNYLPTFFEIEKPTMKTELIHKDKVTMENIEEEEEVKKALKELGYIP